LRPHRSRYWLTPPVERETCEREVQAVCDCYHAAPALAEQGMHTISTDEKPMQVLERAHPGLPLVPGHVERRAFEYVRHGTQCLIANRAVPTGRVVAPSLGPTRTEEDFVVHSAQTVATDAEAGWVFIVDNLNTHRSAGLVEWVAQACGMTADLGVKGSAASSTPWRRVGPSWAIPPSASVSCPCRRTPPGSIRWRSG